VGIPRVESDEVELGSGLLGELKLYRADVAFFVVVLPVP